MKNLQQLAIVTAIAVTSVFAHAQSQHCYKFDESTTICTFHPSGRVNVSTYYSNTGVYFSDWYSKRNWPAALAQLEKAKQIKADKAHAYECTLAQSRGESPSDCPPAPKDTVEQCLKNYAVHPWYVVKDDGTKIIDAGAACPVTK